MSEVDILLMELAPLFQKHRERGVKLLGWDVIQEQEHGPESPSRATDHPFRHHSMIARYEALNLYPK